MGKKKLKNKKKHWLFHQKQPQNTNSRISCFFSQKYKYMCFYVKKSTRLTKSLIHHTNLNFFNMALTLQCDVTTLQFMIKRGKTQICIGCLCLHILCLFAIGSIRDFVSCGKGEGFISFSWEFKMELIFMKIW